MPALPRVAPVVAVPRDEPFDDPEWLFEPKYDGFRGLLYVTRSDCWFRSKQGHVLERFRELCHWVREELPVREAILDGEIVSLDAAGRQSFRDLLAGRGNLHYAAFDALWVEGRDLRLLPLRRRKRALHRLVWASSTVLSQVFWIEERGHDVFAAAERLGIEGIVAKRLADPYVAGETVWYKVRNRSYRGTDDRELFRQHRAARGHARKSGH